MAVLGILSLVIIAYGIVTWASNGRAYNLSLVMWMLPIWFMSAMAGNNTDINGLVVLLGFLLSFETIFASYDVNLWNTQLRTKGKAFVLISYITNTIFAFYFSIQSYTLGYMPFISIFGGLGIYISILWAIVLSICASYAFITTVDRYFSKRKQFVIIKCTPFKDLDKFRMKVRGINGVQNGKNFTFYATRKAYSLIKNEKALIIELREGVLGGMYSSGHNLFITKSRQLKRINRILFRRGAVAFAATLVVVLFFYRVLLGIRFEQMFSALF
ncbi:MAG: hypothetical protein IKU80_04725 [Firmicutes bacterium]|nr:hypothetical protein [Bacillota bacterium]